MNVHIAPDNDNAALLIEAHLLKDLRQQLPQSQNTPFVFTATGSNGELIGGVTANTAYSWLLIKTLWVHTDYRRNGLGNALMRQVEAAGQNDGCHSAWLDTSNPHAKQFYDELGYTVFGELKNNSQQSPALHSRWFMKKPLTGLTAV